jgi:excisionase family DNA binding protein
MPDDFNPTEWITTQEAADLTGYNLGYVRQIIWRGIIVAEKKGRDWWVDKASVGAYADAMKQFGPAKHNPWKTRTRQEATAD